MADCYDLTEVYTKIDCQNDTEEKNRIVSLGILKNASAGLDLTDPAVWETFVGETPSNVWEDNVVSIPNVSGEYDGGSPNTVAGYGLKPQRVAGITHVLTLRFEYHSKNEAFFQKIWRSNNNGIVFLTGDDKNMQVMDKVDALIVPQPAITTEIQDVREQTLTITMAKRLYPNHVAVSDEVKQLFF